MRPKKIGLIAHTGKAGVAELTRTLRSEFERAGLTVLLEAKTAALAGMTSSSTIADLGREADLLVVLGGDGTILHSVGQELPNENQSESICLQGLHRHISWRKVALAYLAFC